MSNKWTKESVFARIEWHAPAVAATVWAGMTYVLALVNWAHMMSQGALTLDAIELQNPGLQRTAIIVLTSVAGAGIAAALHPMLIWTAVALLVSSVGVVSWSYQSYEGFDLAWVIPAMGLIGSGGTVYLVKEFRWRELMVRLQCSLEGLVGPGLIRKIKADPSLFKTKDQEVSATVLAIDIAGFNAISRRFPTDEVLAELRRLYQTIRTVVHMHGGMVFKGFNGSFVCSFGETIFAVPGSKWHAEMALKAAYDLLNQAAPLAITAAEKKRPVFLLRMGVASGRVAFGNLEEGDQFFPTLVGTAHEEARMLQDASAASRILFSKKTYDLLVTIDRSAPMFSKTQVRLAPETELVEVFELDAFHSRPQLREQTLQARQDSASAERAAPRYLIHNPALIVLDTATGEARMVNVSVSGLAIKTNRSLGSASSVRFRFRSDDAEFMKRLANRDLGMFQADVMWQREQGGEFTYGLQYKRVAEDDLQFLLQCILDCQEAATRSRAA